MEFWSNAFQITIDSYYAGNLNAGLEACERLLSVAGLPPDVELQTRRNLPFYAPKLHELATATKTWSIGIPVRPGWSSFNPSIIQSSDGFRMTVRSSNYHYDGSVTAMTINDPHSVIRTENYLVDLDVALGIRGVELIDDKEFRAESSSFHVRGFEDCRLFTHQGSLWANAAVRDRSESGTCQTALMRIECASVTDLVLLSDGMSRHEKNWMPVATQNVTALLFVYSCFPTIVLRYDGDQRTAVPDIIQPAPLIGRWFSGGTQVIPFQKGWLCLVHEAVNLADGNRLYTHRWVFFDQNWRLSQVSNPFIFQGLGVEFAGGLAQRGDELIISYGLWDREAWLATVRVTAVLQLLAPPLDQAAAEAAVRGTPIMVRSLIAPSFRPAAAYLLAEPPQFAVQSESVLVEDVDVGPMLVDPDDTGVGHCLRHARTWEPGEGRFIRSFLRPGMNAIDVGANIGYFTLFMAREVGPEGKVLAIEAEPENFRLLRSNVERNQLINVELLPVAAHRAPGLMTVSRNESNRGGSQVAGSTANWNAWPVQAIRLDDVLHQDAAIDFVKIDVEGLDHAVVQGLEQTIRRWSPTLLVELNPWAIETYGESAQEALRLYRQLGLEIRLLGGDALRLQREGGTDIEKLLLDNLIVTAEVENELIERTRQIHWVNLILTPKSPRTAIANGLQSLVQ